MVGRVVNFVSPSESKEDWVLLLSESFDEISVGTVLDSTNVEINDSVDDLTELSVEAVVEPVSDTFSLDVFFSFPSAFP